MPQCLVPMPSLMLMPNAVLSLAPPHVPSPCQAPGVPPERARSCARGRVMFHLPRQFHKTSPNPPKSLHTSILCACHPRKPRRNFRAGLVSNMKVRL